MFLTRTAKHKEIFHKCEKTASLSTVRTIERRQEMENFNSTGHLGINTRSCNEPFRWLSREMGPREA